MIDLYVTKKLQAKLSIDDKGMLPGSSHVDYLADKPEMESNPLSGWHANLRVMQRRQCVIFVHNETRFPVFVPCLTKPNFSRLEYFFIDAFMNTLMKCGASMEHMDAAQYLLERFKIDSNYSRSVQGTMNQMCAEIETYLWYDNVNIMELSGYSMGVHLANTPCSVNNQKKYIVPKRAMLELLGGLVKSDGESVTDDLMDDNMLDLEFEKELAQLDSMMPVEDSSSNEISHKVVSFDDYRKK